MFLQQPPARVVPPPFPAVDPVTDPNTLPNFDDDGGFDEVDHATRLDASLPAKFLKDAPLTDINPAVPAADERTRAVNIRNDPRAMSDIDWDLD